MVSSVFHVIGRHDIYKLGHVKEPVYLVLRVWLLLVGEWRVTK